ncbi:hypothetical protein [Streptomyces sp. NBC_00887]|uniref:hypothetical protein n=1 Tax=Streptomyces sp. NBC_00887 TaxID=2975859 RepID=UPI00386ED4EE|nr:hypothetical protein OG844_01470 [Streptomyces sp. NBC_00887]WSY36172.1 hypothetical protein OG844_44130 [Streptomyces sp. NBC_00887]
MTSRENGPDDIDTEGKAVPPYEGRRRSGDVRAREKSIKGGAKIAGATGPVTDDDAKAAAPERTDRGATASPSDREPTERSAQRGSEDTGTGPAHRRGTGRAEDQS